MWENADEGSRPAIDSAKGLCAYGPDMTSRQSTQTPTRRVPQRPGPEILGARTPSGDQMLDPDGGKIGVIQELMIDVASGRIAYAVVAMGGLLGLPNYSLFPGRR